MTRNFRTVKGDIELALTREEYLALRDLRNRPLTDGPMRRRRLSDTDPRTDDGLSPVERFIAETRRGAA
jgi:hypothetical protein